MRATATGVITAISLVGALALAHGCASQATTVCELICECEHCNDVEEELSCAQIETSADIAEVYGCDAEWEAYAVCYEEKGKCNEKEASFSTQAPGRCDGLAPTGFPCTTQVDCEQLGSFLTCDAGQCSQRVCSGPDEYPCENDDDCPGGEDRCQDEAVKLNECQSEASGHDRDIGGNPEPQPPSGG